MSVESQIKLQRVIVLVPPAKNDDAFRAKICENVSKPLDQQETRQEIVNGLIDELKKPYFLIIKRHESRGAKLLDKMDGDHLIMALLPAEAIGEIEQIPEAQIRPLSEGMTLAERPVENVWEP